MQKAKIERGKDKGREEDKVKVNKRTASSYPTGNSLFL